MKGDVWQSRGGVTRRPGRATVETVTMKSRVTETAEEQFGEQKGEAKALQMEV